MIFFYTFPESGVTVNLSAICSAYQKENSNGEEIAVVELSNTETIELTGADRDKCFEIIEGLEATAKQMLFEMTGKEF